MLHTVVTGYNPSLTFDKIKYVKWCSKIKKLQTGLLQVGGQIEPSACQRGPVCCGQWRAQREESACLAEVFSDVLFDVTATDLSRIQLTKLSWGEFTDCVQKRKQKKTHFWMSDGLSFFYLETRVSLLPPFFTSFSFNPLGAWPDAAARRVDLPVRSRLISFPWCGGFFAGCLLVKPFLFFKTLFIIFK